MKPRLTPTGQEVSFPPDELIVSKTDLSGRITYVNRVFMKVCNYPEEALLGVQHNIVRHPDMPRGAFRLMWDTLKGGHEFFGIVKNMTAQGHHYWVFANVTIDRRQGHPVGYFSVRRQAPTQAIAVVEPLYRQMMDIERATSAADAPAASLAWLEGQLAGLGVSYERFVLDLYNRHSHPQGSRR